MMVYIIALFSILCSAFAQFFLKMGVQRLSVSTDNGFWLIARKVIADWPLLCGIGCYIVSMLFWLYVLSKMEMSRAYPLVSIGYVFTLIIGWFFLGESVTVGKLLGIFFIMVGVFFVSRL